MSQKRIKTYQEFWPYYLSQHAKPETKKFHSIGTLLGVIFFLYCFLDHRPLWYPLSFVIGYSFSWYSHFFIEKNKPATFQYPIWSFISDFRMAYLWFTKKIE